MTALPRRPLVGLALLFVVGMSLGRLCMESPVLPLAATAVCLALAIILHRTRHPAAGFLSDLLVLVSVLQLGWAHVAMDRPTAPVIALRAAGPGIDFEAGLIGAVADEPVRTEQPGKRPAWSFPLDVMRFREHPDSAWQDASGTVRIRLFAGQNSRIPAYGERWSVSGRLDQPVFKQGRLTGKPAGLYLTTSSRNASFLSPGQGNVLTRRCLAVRAWSASLLKRGIEDFPEQVTILNSLLLGYYSRIPRELYQAFASTGTLHVFAISGSHVVIVCAVIIFGLAACGLPRTHWILFLAPLLLGYTLMTGMQSSAVRACIMAILFWTAPLLGRKADVFTALAASAILILVVSPAELSGIGFVLSFVAVIGLVLFYPVFAAPLRRRFQPDPLQIEPEPLWIRTLRRIWLHIADLLAMSLAACLVSAPLTAWYFEMFSPIGLLGNLLAVPVSSLIIATGFLSLVFGACAGFLADLFNHANLLLIYLLTATIRLFAAIPYGHMTVAPPPPWFLPVFYGLLASLRFSLWMNQPTQDDASVNTACSIPRDAG
jgi:competence protein ComEC